MAGNNAPQSAADGFRDILGRLGQVMAAPDANDHIIQFVGDLQTAIATFLKMPPAGQNMGSIPPNGGQMSSPDASAPGGSPMGMPPGAGAPTPDLGGAGGPGGPPPGQPPGPAGMLQGQPSPNGVMPLSKMPPVDELRRMLEQHAGR